ncbi:YARHG domain-containing protein [Pseudobutyrivibrio sp. YE44]|uniref:YARHG domain-containing protein n=1 Tax=Pseudobutyrivibrio sp. YE44 TaxID=1520802 RepID=UPI000891FE79|nr:YARHG domain-containing protein [Pseudobutyrivibrio sp. YE44]SDB31420.1 YARHG domain-containing protein [Pseudobutyrivibrio sp. YE44]
MEEFRDRVLDAVDWVFDRFYDAKDFLTQHPNAKRWIIEGVSCVVVGILVGVLTFNILNHEKKKLAVTDENAATPVQEQGSEENIEAGSSMDGVNPDDFADVVIEVVDPGEYASNIAGWSDAEIEAAVTERSGHLEGNKYWGPVSQYWESKGITGNARYCTYLADTANKVYSPSDFDGIAPEVIHAIKNEMYARHGYSFRDQDLYNYFMGQIWYEPTVLPADFSEKTFTETEVKNLDMLNSIDPL